MTEEVKVQITKPGHIMQITEASTLEKVVASLEKLQKDCRLSGMALAIAHVRGMAAEAKTETILTNVQHALKGGIDLTTHNLMYRGDANEAWLIGVPAEKEE